MGKKRSFLLSVSMYEVNHWGVRTPPSFTCCIYGGSLHATAEAKMKRKDALPSHLFPIFFSFCQRHLVLSIKKRTERRREYRRFLHHMQSTFLFFLLSLSFARLLAFCKETERREKRRERGMYRNIVRCIHRDV